MHVKPTDSHAIIYLYVQLLPSKYLQRCSLQRINLDIEHSYMLSLKSNLCAGGYKAHTMQSLVDKITQKRYWKPFCNTCIKKKDNSRSPRITTPRVFSFFTNESLCRYSTDKDRFTCFITGQTYKILSQRNGKT